MSLYVCWSALMRAGRCRCIRPPLRLADRSFRSVRPPRAYVPGTPATDPERSRAEAARRARAKVRRYCAANRLNRLGTLTYRGAGCHDPLQLRARRGGVLPRPARRSGGKPFPYLWVRGVAQDRPRSARALRGGAVHRHASRIEAAWGHGFVHIKRLSDLPVGSTSVHEARRAAGYLSKYVTKSFDPDSAAHLAGTASLRGRAGFPAGGDAVHRAVLGRRCWRRLSRRWGIAPAICVVLGGGGGLAGSAGGVVRMGLSNVPAEVLAAWVAASCAGQGVPVKVTDPTVVRRVGALLGAGVAGPRERKRSGTRGPDGPWIGGGLVGVWFGFSAAR